MAVKEAHMASAVAVRVTSFGEGRKRVRVPAGTATVGSVLSAAGVSSDRRRVALNGHPVNLGAGVLEDDEVTVVPRVQGG